ncbi:MAG: LysM peptidoglycan-binding domain-containing protein [Schleiferiaceae bacterium]|nr:LysM peptidoglycan-binding domain-containing protein [Schleiferiaceae bacterium]
MKRLFSLFAFCFSAVLCPAQVPEVFSRLQQAEDYWYDLTKLKAGNALDSCPSATNLAAHFSASFTAATYYEPLAADYARFFSRHRCEALSLYEEVAFFALEQLQDSLYANFFRSNGYLAVFLTGLHPVFDGDFGRKGFWGLTYPTARKYGLRVDDLIDERFSILHATRVAWWYYFDLQVLYNEADLVRLAFVTSPAALEKSIQASITSASNEGSLPLETAQTLFELDLLRHVFHADWIGVKTNRVLGYDAQFADITPRGLVRFDAAEEVLALPKGGLKKWNPVFLQGVYPENYRNTPLRMPKKYAEKFKQLEDTITALSVAKELGILDKPPVVQAVKTPSAGAAVTYKVKPGDALGLIATRHGVSVADLMQWNTLKNDKIFVGQKLLIYNVKEQLEVATPTPAAPKKEPVEKPKGTPKIYVVKEGDNLWMISQLYPGVSADAIAEWNAIKNNQIYPGQQLKIYDSND